MKVYFSCFHTTVCKNEKFSLTWKISWNQLFNNFFCKNVFFLVFCQTWARVNFRNFYSTLCTLCTLNILIVGEKNEKFTLEYFVKSIQIRNIFFCFAYLAFHLTSKKFLVPFDDFFKGKLFDCVCSRCQAPWDTENAIKCLKCKSGNISPKKVSNF